MLWRILLVLLFLASSGSVSAQGLKISTQIYDLSGDESGQVLSSSLSLCHNGRVYDYVDTVQEVVIYDPVERRFTILNFQREIRTVLTFDEIGQLLESRRPITDAWLTELRASRNPDDARMARSLSFQLSPDFTETFDASSGALTLASRSFTYRVDTRKWNDTEQVERYLAAADWTARLNSILHPSSLFPEPRLALNAALRKRTDRMPVRVELDLRPEESLRLRAEHQLTPQLAEADHNRIARWEAERKSARLREVSFRNYQETVLLTTSK